MKSIQTFLNEGVEATDEEFKSWRKNGCNCFNKFIKANPEFDNPEFKSYVVQRNKADCDSGEINDICLAEIKRLSTEFRRG